MIVMVNECVGCPPEMGCMGAACPNKNVERHVCDECGNEAEYALDDEELCKDCLREILDKAWNEIDIEEKAAMLEMELEKLDD